MGEYRTQVSSLYSRGYGELCSLPLPSRYSIGMNEVTFAVNGGRAYFLYKQVTKLGFNCIINEDSTLITVSKGSSYYESN